MNQPPIPLNTGTNSFNTSTQTNQEIPSQIINGNLENWQDYLTPETFEGSASNGNKAILDEVEITSVFESVGTGNDFSFSSGNDAPVSNRVNSSGINLRSINSDGTLIPNPNDLINPSKILESYNSIQTGFEDFNSSSSSTSIPILSSKKESPIPLNFVPPTFFNPPPPTTNTKSSKSRRSGGSHHHSSKPNQADEAIPEAALHLLRLGLPSTSTSVTGTGSVATTSTTLDDDASCDEDAEGESDATSFHSEDDENRGTTSTSNNNNANDSNQQNQSINVSTLPRKSHSQPSHSRSGSQSGISNSMDVRSWNYGKETVQIPIVSVRGGPPSVSSSRSIGTNNSQGRIRQHRPARAMSSRASEDGRATSPNGGEINSENRRTSGRVRKPVLPSKGKDSERRGDGEESDELFSMSEGEDGYNGNKSSEDEDMEDQKKKGKGKAKPRKSIKRSSSMLLEDGQEPPAKKPKVVKVPKVKKLASTVAGSTASSPSGSISRPRRAKVFLPSTIPRRTFDPAVEVKNELFPRFYRCFPLSRAFHPESFVNRLKGVGEVLAKKSARLSKIDDILISASASASTSANIMVDSNLNGNDGASGSGAGIESSSSASTSGIFSSNTSPQNQNNLFPPPASINNNNNQSELNGLPAIDLNPVTFMNLPEGAVWNKTGEPFNLYQPRFIKGTGEEKAGLCPICVEPPERGGEGQEKWLKLKNSTYVYHASYYHGVSNLTGLPFSPPVSFRVVEHKDLQKDARVNMVEGLCHKCNVWIQVQSVKNVDAVIPEIFFWKHAKKCHGKSTHPGETDIYLKDKVFDLVNSRRADQSAGLGDTSEEEEESDDRDESENEGKRRRRR